MSFNVHQPSTYVLGSVIHNASNHNLEFHQAMSMGVRAEMFEGIERDLWLGCEAAIAADRNIEPGQILEALGTDHAVRVCEYLELLCDYPYTLNLKAYCEDLIEAYKRVWLKQSLVGIERNDDAPAELERILNEMHKISPSQHGDIRSTAEDFVADLERKMSMAKGDGIPTGFPSLDAAIFGLLPGTLTVVAARPGYGKTTFGCNVARNVIRAGHRVLFFTVEMLSRELMAKMVAIDGNIALRRMIEPWTLNDGETDRLMASTRAIGGSKNNRVIHFDGKLSKLRSDVRKYKHEDGIQLCIVDYLGLIEPDTDKTLKTTYDKVSHVIEELKRIFLDLELPALVLCQLRREQNAVNRAPTEADLRDSGKIEQAADNVIVLHGIMNGDTIDQTTRTLIIRKNRRGRKDQAIALRTNFETGRMEEMA
jgi:replicative DNA helicase